MSKIKEHQVALKLRQEGKSYNQIRKQLGVSKSTLSSWLYDHPLTKEQIKILKNEDEVRIEKFRCTMQTKRDKRLLDCYKEEKNTLLPLTKKELFLTGLFLYWGEGRKGSGAQLSLNNTDPQVLKFTLGWIIRSLRVPKSKIRVNVHLYSDMSVEKEKKFWSDMLNLPLSQFCTPYIKQSKQTYINHKGFNHGTCGLVVNDVRLHEKVLMAIKAIADFYSGQF